MSEVLVAGAGGALGGHLTRRLLDEGYNVRCVDLKPMDDWFQVHDGTDCYVGDLRQPSMARSVMFGGITDVYDLACDMGGIGYIYGHKAQCATSVSITVNMLEAAVEYGIERFFYTSSACVYPVGIQDDANVTALKEADAWPAQPEPGYGEEKLFSERLCQYFREEHGLRTVVARLHNVYGPHGSWKGGKEKAPAAICRKVAQAVLSGSYAIDIWGDGEQTRSFMYVDDFVEGVRLLTEVDYAGPINLGTSELVSINQLVTIVEGIAGVDLERRYQPDEVQGVRGRNSDNTLIREVLGWEPSIPLATGLAKTYEWINQQLLDDGCL